MIKPLFALTLIFFSCQDSEAIKEIKREDSLKREVLKILHESKMQQLNLKESLYVHDQQTQKEIEKLINK